MTQWVPAFGILGAMLFYALFLYRHALNIPFNDDIFDVLQVLNGIVQSNDLKDTLTVLSAQFIEHRTFSSRLVYYLVLLITGEVNFRTLVFLANLAIPLLLVLFYLAIRHHSRVLLVLFPAALILFSLRAYELMFWPMAGFSNMYVYLYAFASLSCLRDVGLIRFLAALLFAALGAFTLASGQLIWLFGFASLLHQALIVRRISLSYAICWAFCAVFVLLVWHMNFEPTGSIDSMFKSLRAVPLYKTQYFFALLGSAFSDRNLLLAMGAGVVMLCLVVFFSIRSFADKDVTLMLFAWYIILCAFLVTLGRSGDGVAVGFIRVTVLEAALKSRYSFSSLLLAATIIVLVASQRNFVHAGKAEGFTFFSVILLSAVFWGYSFKTYQPLLQSRLEKRVNHYNREEYLCFFASNEETSLIVNEAISLGIYRPPARPHPRPSVVPTSE